MEKTLGEIFEEARRTPPQMTYTSRVRVEYIGKYRISALRAVRSCTGLSLKSAKEAIEWPGGFEVSGIVYAAIVEAYLSHPTTSLGGHGSDWREIKERPAPIVL
jgi:hypothetical protein